jgi:hypothetical protein
MASEKSGFGDKVDSSDIVNKATEILIEDKPGSVDIDKAVTSTCGDLVSGSSGKVVGAGKDAVAFVCPIHGNRGSVIASSNLNKQQLSVLELIVHFENLLLKGYYPTRWEHQRFGRSEMMPSGEWAYEIPRECRKQQK